MFKLWYYIYLFTSPTPSLKGLFFMFPFPFPFVVFTNWFVLSLNKICSVTLMYCIQNEVLRYDSVKLLLCFCFLFFFFGRAVLYIFLVSSSFLIFVVNITFGNFNYLSDLYFAQEVSLFPV